MKSLLSQWRIQDIPEVGPPTQWWGGGVANTLFCQNFPKDCMQLKEFERRRGGGAHPLHPGDIYLFASKTLADLRLQGTYK